MVLEKRNKQHKEGDPFPVSTCTPPHRTAPAQPRLPPSIRMCTHARARAHTCQQAASGARGGLHGDGMSACRVHACMQRMRRCGINHRQGRQACPPACRRAFRHACHHLPCPVPAAAAPMHAAVRAVHVRGPVHGGLRLRQGHELLREVLRVQHPLQGAVRPHAYMHACMVVPRAMRHTPATHAPTGHACTWACLPCLPRPLAACLPALHAAVHAAGRVLLRQRPAASARVARGCMHAPALRCAALCMHGPLASKGTHAHTHACMRHTLHALTAPASRPHPRLPSDAQLPRLHVRRWWLQGRALPLRRGGQGVRSRPVRRGECEELHMHIETSAAHLHTYLVLAASAACPPAWP